MFKKLIRLFQLNFTYYRIKLKSFILYKIIYRFKIKKVRIFFACYFTFLLSIYTLQANLLSFEVVPFVMFLIFLIIKKFINPNFNKINSINKKMIFIIYFIFKLSLGNSFLIAPAFTKVCIIYLTFTLTSELYCRLLNVY